MARTFTLVAPLALALSAGMALAQGMPAELSPTGPMKGAPEIKVQPGAGPALPTDPATAPRITFDATDHNFGAITDEAPVTHKFRFTNTGKGPLEMGNLTGSCGCTVPQLEKKTYAPGESGEITVTYNPANRQGSQHTTITVNSNDPTAPIQTLNVRSTVKPMVGVEPKVITLGNIERGQPVTQTAKFITRIPGLTVASVASNNPRTEAVVLPAVEEEIEGEKVTVIPIQITIKDTSKTGTVQDLLTIRTSDEKRALLNCTVMGEILGELVTLPKSLSVGGKGMAESFATQIRVQSRKSKPFKVLGVQSIAAQGPNVMGFQVANDPSAQYPTYVITVNGVSPTEPGSFRGDIVISTDMEGEQEIRIPYFGFVRAQQRQVPPGGVANPVGQPVANDPWQQRPSSLIPR